MRIALDAMGGDKAPAAPVEGALAALSRFADLEIWLVGDPDVLAKELHAHGGARSGIHVVPSEGVVGILCAAWPTAVVWGEDGPGAFHRLAEGKTWEGHRDYMSGLRPRGKAADYAALAAMLAPDAQMASEVWA